MFYSTTAGQGTHKSYESPMLQLKLGKMRIAFCPFPLHNFPDRILFSKIWQLSCTRKTYKPLLALDTTSYQFPTPHALMSLRIED